jgi:hypothetical protein
MTLITKKYYNKSSIYIFWYTFSFCDKKKLGNIFIMKNSIFQQIKLYKGES